ncbi:hypothetical protein N0V84_003841 [Fusarium piperis]|uniref:Uncharacterized protein n=1 Tax=Fusarium piperis TaxID=1435070 RepID=A0A9W9BS31_9HYPO|nr:hypothetical protein N0V84_003841 [Fusarium piperis]
MGNMTPEERTRLRAREIQRLHAAHVKNGPLKFAEAITEEDLKLANTIQPNWERLGGDENEYPENWVLKKGSLGPTLRFFRKNARKMIEGHVLDDVGLEADDKEEDQVDTNRVGTDTMEYLRSLHIDRPAIKHTPPALKPTNQGYREKDKADGDRLDRHINTHCDESTSDRLLKRVPPDQAVMSGGLGPMTNYEGTRKATGLNFPGYLSPSRNRNCHGLETPPQGNVKQVSVAVIESQALVDAKNEELDIMGDTVSSLNKECATWKRIALEKETALQDRIKKLDAAQKKLRQTEKDNMVLIEKEQKIMEKMEQMMEKMEQMKLELASTELAGEGQDIQKEHENEKHDTILTPSNLKRLQALMVKAGVVRG